VLYQEEYTGGVGWGYSGALGILVGYNNIKFTSEIKFISMIWTPNLLKIGTNQTQDIQLKDEVTSDSNDQLKISFPFSSLSINIGTIINCPIIIILPLHWEFYLLDYSWSPHLTLQFNPPSFITKTL
jgi:hypothetical protein